jgi:hypothetical protein
MGGVDPDISMVVLRRARLNASDAKVVGTPCSCVGKHRTSVAKLVLPGGQLAFPKGKIHRSASRAVLDYKSW